jgi:hypothetical protein
MPLSFDVLIATACYSFIAPCLGALEAELLPKKQDEVELATSSPDTSK